MAIAGFVEIPHFRKDSFYKAMLKGERLAHSDHPAIERAPYEGGLGALEGAGMRRARGARALKKSRRKPSAEKHPRVQVGGLVATVRLTEHHAPE